MSSSSWNVVTQHESWSTPTEPAVTTNWFGTYHSPESDGKQLLIPFDPHSVHITYIRGQWEQPDPDVRPHFQFVVIFKKPCRERQAREWLRSTKEPYTPYIQYISPARTIDGALLYVSKDASRVGETLEYGTAPAGKSLTSGYTSAFNMAREGISLKLIADKFPDVFLRHGANLSKYASFYQKKRNLDKPPEVYIYYGITGSGKSYKANTENPDAYKKMGNPKWWDRYDGEETVIFEEFNPIDVDNPYNKFPLTEMLQILDRYSLQGEIKGTSTQLMANRFIFTTNIDPTTWWKGHPQQSAFLRRITKIFYFPKTYNAETMDEPYYYEVQVGKPGTGLTNKRPVMSNNRPAKKAKLDEPVSELEDSELTPYFL